MSCSRFILQLGHSGDCPFVSMKMKTKAWDQDDPHKSMDYTQMATEFKEELSYLTIEQLEHWIRAIAVREEEINVKMQKAHYSG